MSIDERKSVLTSKELAFLGYRISAQGMRPDTELVDKIKAVERPTCKRELESFLGMVNFYRHYLPRFAYVMTPLRDCVERMCRSSLERGAAVHIRCLKRSFIALPTRTTA